MLHITRIVLIVLVIVLGRLPAQAQPRRGLIAVADFAHVYTNYFKTKLAVDQLREMAAGINAEQLRMKEELNARQNKFTEVRDRSMAQDLEVEERSKLRAQAEENIVEMRRLEGQVKEYTESQKKLLDTQTRRIRESLQGEIREKIDRYGRDNGILLIIDRSKIDEAGLPAILYYDETMDVTADLLREVNR